MRYIVNMIVQVRGKSWLGKSVIDNVGELWRIDDINEPFMTLTKDNTKVNDIVVSMYDDDPHFEVKA